VARKAGRVIVLLSGLVSDLPSFGSAQKGGPIVIDRENPHSFCQENGERFFPMGDTAYFLIVQPLETIARYIDSRRAHHFNFVRMMAVLMDFGPSAARPSIRATT
jgi:hypothetical protein